MPRPLFALLCLSVWINYIDRGTLSVAAPALRPELGLGPTEMGVLLSAFFWTYSLMQPLAGWLVDRYNVYLVYSIGFGLWSASVMAAGFTHTLTGLMISRLALGVGESVAYPSYSRLLVGGFAEKHRGLANALIDVGTKAGPALGTFLGANLIQSFGWRPFFIWMGGLSLLWLLPWFLMIPRGRTETVIHRSAIPIGTLLGLRQAWATFIGLFSYNYAFYFLLTWLPSYLVSERGFTMKEMSIFGALPFAATAVAAIVTASMVDARIRQGADPGGLRRGVAVFGLLLFAVMLMTSALVGKAMAMVCLVAAFIGMGVFTANAWAITQTLAGKRAAGTWTGWQNAVANMGGVVAPILTGWSLSVTESYLTAFAVATGMLLISAACYGLMLGRVENVIPE